MATLRPATCWMRNNMAKEKKEKVIYVDDGRTLADMSGVTGGFGRSGVKRPRQPGRAKEIWNTYWRTVKMMILPMLTVVGGMIVVYLLMYLLFRLR